MISPELATVLACIAAAFALAWAVVTLLDPEDE